MITEQTPLIRHTGLMPLDGSGMVPLVWTKEKPTATGWYWYKRFHRDGSPYSGVVCIEEDRGAQLIIVSIGYVRDCEGEWAGPIPQPGPEPTLSAQHFYRVEDVERVKNEYAEVLRHLLDAMISLHPESKLVANELENGQFITRFLEIGSAFDPHGRVASMIEAHRLLDRLRGK